MEAPVYAFDTPVRQLDELLRVRRELVTADLPTEAVDQAIHIQLASLKAEQEAVDEIDEEPDRPPASPEEEHAA
jgi:hypothetical protein